MIVDSLVIVATELTHDPLLKTISEAADEGTVAQMLANSTTVTRLAEPRIEAMLREDAGHHFRRGIHPQDLTQFLIATALSLLLGIVPDSENADVASITLRSSSFPPSSETHPSRVRCSPGLRTDLCGRGKDRLQLGQCGHRGGDRRALRRGQFVQRRGHDVFAGSVVAAQ